MNTYIFNTENKRAIKHSNMLKQCLAKERNNLKTTLKYKTTMNSTTDIQNPTVNTLGSIDLRKQKLPTQEVVMYTAHEVSQKLYDLSQSMVKKLGISNNTAAQFTSEFIKMNIKLYKPNTNLNQQI